MSPKAVYRGVLASAALAGVVAIALSFALEDRLPPPLKAWAQNRIRNRTSGSMTPQRASWRFTASSARGCEWRVARRN